MLGSAAGAGAMSPLSSKLAGHAVIAATLTGLGERAHLLSPQIGLDTHASDIVGVLRCRDLNGVVLVGHSYGGPVITTVAERMPDRIRWARLQPRQLPAHARAARRNQAVVADHAAQPAGQNRRQDRPPRSLSDLPNDRGRGAACAVPDCPRRNYGSPAAAAGVILSMPPRAVGVSIGGTSAPKSGAVNRKTCYLRLRRERGFKEL
jgi:pimeloyl-ACP methyl ester carboxylesterase